ncbi:hypothetical protein NHX12_004438 [Muraenolepis orangiensis]|uniref:Chemokine interleukin-8-like domain-containing protein n=1 Tax=Muraenolepis orangiensis TaxID=630683 RepID=A0A9Q0DVH3_9TELE|nr:hypothetical protein NHX12_004438 [Muraenolepis orangiensis]
MLMMCTLLRDTLESLLGLFPPGGIADCCRKIKNTEVQRARLRSYYEQTSQVGCHLHAVVFTTVKNKRICADPNREWTKLGKAYVDGRNSVKGTKGTGCNENSRPPCKELISKSVPL